MGRSLPLALGFRVGFRSGVGGWFRSHNGFAGELLVLQVGVNAGRFGFVRTTFCGEFPVLQVGVDAGLLLPRSARVIC